MNKQEFFKDIPGYEGYYQVSNLGSVKSLSRSIKLSNGRYRVLKEKILKPTLNSTGYLLVILYKDGKQKAYKIHQLLAMAFLGHIPCGHKLIVDHINNNPLDNRVENLQIVTTRKNCSKDKKGYSSEYVGVSWNTKDKKWRSAISINGKDKYLGSFECEIEASEAYQQEKNKLKT